MICDRWDRNKRTSDEAKITRLLLLGGRQPLVIKTSYEFLSSKSGQAFLVPKTGGVLVGVSYANVVMGGVSDDCM